MTILTTLTAVRATSRRGFEMGFKLPNIDVLGALLGKAHRRSLEQAAQAALDQAKPVLMAAVSLALGSIPAGTASHQVSGTAQKLVDGVFASPVVQKLAPADALAAAKQAASDAIAALAVTIPADQFEAHAKVVVVAAIAGAKVPTTK